MNRMQELKDQRNSNLELYRIIVMLLIVAHHYVVNSGLIGKMQATPLTTNSVFLYLFGMWGKTGIDCFVLITGYFMCKSTATIRKFFKLLFEVMFYKIVIYLIFVATGLVAFTLTGFIRALIPISNVGDGFTTGFILFYLFIPFINILISNIDKLLHQKLILLCLFIYTLWYMLPGFQVSYNYITWFIVLYLISSYIRLYPFNRFKTQHWGYLSLLLVCISSASVITLRHMEYGNPYRFVSDSNAILALLTALSTFMYFKDLKIKQSKCINTIASSCFGVLLIHANSDAMRQWLWHDTLRNIDYLDSPYCALHAFASILLIYITCTLIDLMRIRFIERPFFNSALYHMIENKTSRLLHIR